MSNARIKKQVIARLEPADYLRFSRLAKKKKRSLYALAREAILSYMNINLKRSAKVTDLE